METIVEYQENKEKQQYYYDSNNIAHIEISQNKQDYKKKQAPEKEINPMGEKMSKFQKNQNIYQHKYSEKIYEENKKKDKKQKDYIEQKKFYFKQRQEQFKNQQILSQLKESFDANKIAFNTLWDNSENNLKAQINAIQKEVLKPIKVVLSQKEMHIILKNQNQLVIGRSGTGKTTTAVAKLASMQKSYQKQQNQNQQCPEQLRICFTTVSNFLTIDVENFYLMVINNNQQKTKNFSKPNTISQVNRWPHFSNIKQLILQIDGNLVVPFIQRDANGQVQLKENMEINLENRLRVQLKDQIENYFYEEIGIKQFVEEFWSQNKKTFNSQRVDPYITFSQINSYITGHPSSHMNENNMISLEKYINLIGKSKIFLDEEQKQNIHRICGQYQKWKQAKRYFDMNDIINYSIKNILAGHYDAQNGYFHYLFLDEVQDVSCACLYLLSLLTEQSVYLGGDTAQTISQENSFRFSDLKAIFGGNNQTFGYEVNKVLQQEINEAQLIQNFRSHGQIIELNNSIVRLLELFFPTSLDHLIPEISLKNGPKPILLSERTLLDRFLQQDCEANFNVNYFGRLQVYIVKDKEQKENLQKIFQEEGKKGQIFTVLESKGLEFQDVITYNLLSSSYSSTKCWNALNLLKINDENIPIQEFKQKYNCVMKEEFEGSTFLKLKGSKFVTVKTINKKENFDAQKDKEYGNEFNKLINELKNIYVAFSRARTRIFIYEDNVFVGKQIKNPIIKFFENLNLLQKSELNEEEMKNILIYHYEYIQKHEPIKNNKQLFIQMAEILMERNQFLDAANYYFSIKDIINYNMCIAKNNIILIQKQIEEKKDQFEKEKKQVLSGQDDDRKIQFYINIKNQFMKVIKDLEQPKDQELNAQIYFKLGMYNEAIQKYKQFKNYLLEQPNQEQKKIKEINNNIKRIYFIKAYLLETSGNNNKEDLVQNYKELENFLEDRALNPKTQLFLSYRLNECEKLFNNLIQFKKQKLIEEDDIIRILHYYYPKILDIKLQRIMDINIVNNKEPKELDPKEILGQVLMDLIKQVLNPFSSELIRIAESRQNKEFLEGQLKFFESLANIRQFKNLDSEGKYINGKNLMLFYIMLVQFDCVKEQKRFIDILQSQVLLHQIYIDQIFQINDNQEQLEQLFNEMKDKSWLKPGKEINIEHQYYYNYLGLYQYLKSSQLVLSTSESKEYDQYLDFTFKLSNFQREIEKDSIYYYKFSNYQDRIKNYSNAVQLLTKSNDFKEFELKDAIKNINKIIENKSTSETQKESKIKNFENCQDNFLKFFCILQNLQIKNMELYDNQIIESLTSLINYIFNFDIQFSDNYVKGIQNKIFLDGFCQCFGYISQLFFFFVVFGIFWNMQYLSFKALNICHFSEYYYFENKYNFQLKYLFQLNRFVSPFLPGTGCDLSSQSKEVKSVWQLLGINDYYLVHYDNPILTIKFLEKDKLISPLISKDKNNLKIIDKKTAILLSKKKFVNLILKILIFILFQQKGDICGTFLKNYSQFLMSNTQSIKFYSLNPSIKINYPFQILFLNQELQKLMNKIQEQVNILVQNIPKNHSRQLEIETIISMIHELDQCDLQNFQQQKLENLKNLLKKKINNQNRQKQANDIQKKEELVNDKQICLYKNLIIQSGLIIGQNIQNRNKFIEKTKIQVFLLEEAERILAQIINKIHISEMNVEQNEDFENQKQQFLNKKEKFDQQFQKMQQNQTVNQGIISQGSQNINKNKYLQLLDKEQSEKEEELEDKEDLKEEENEQQDILQSCDEILYVITILNMLNQRRIIIELLKPYQQKQLVQFTQLCISFLDARNILSRIKIGQLSIELISCFKQNINRYTQLNILKIGLAEIFLLLNTSQVKEKISVYIPQGFENCFTFDQSTNQINVQAYSTIVDYQQIYQYINGVLDLLANYQLSLRNKISICNMFLQILIIFLKNNTFVVKQQDFINKICKFLEYFYKGLKQFDNKLKPFISQYQYQAVFDNADKSDQDQKENNYFYFRKRFHKTFLSLVKREINPQYENMKNKFSLIQFILSIKPKQIQHILIQTGEYGKGTQFQLQIHIVKKKLEDKDVELLEEQQEIKSEIEKISKKMKQNIEQEELTQDDYINMFYKPDFTIFLNQVVFSNRNIQELCQNSIKISIPTFQDSFLKAVVQIQRVRKIFLQELHAKQFQSSEKYIYIIQKLTSIYETEKQFYEKLVCKELYNNPNFENLVQNDSIHCINSMTKVYQDYLNYIAEPVEKIKKEKLNIKKFIQEEIDSEN